MNYSELKTNILEIAEDGFTDAQIAMFVQQAEEKIYQLCSSLPVLRRNQTGSVTADNPYLSLPSDFLAPLSLAVKESGGAYRYLIFMDTNFIREAYPDPTSTGLPKHYGFFDEDTAILGPTPDSSYAVEIHYGQYPESIVTASTTWLGDNASSALLNGALIEAVRFMKGEEDVATMYDKMYAQSIQLLKNLSDGQLRGDAYRYGQRRTTVK